MHRLLNRIQTAHGIDGMRRTLLLLPLLAPFMVGALRMTRAAAATEGVIVFDGDSVSRGLGASPGQGPDAQLGRILGRPVRISNVAISGLPVFKAVAKFAQDVTPRYDPQAAFNIVAFHAGDNDVAAGKTADETYASLTEYIRMAHAQGWTVIVSTELARPTFSPEKQAYLADYNTMMRHNAAGADAVIDYAAIAGLSEVANRAGSPFYQHDQVHPSDRGYGILAEQLKAAILKLVA